MPDQAERCPLCGGEPAKSSRNGAYLVNIPAEARYCANPKCGEATRNWPRIAELVADNARLQEWEQRAVASMDAACKAVGVECCDQIPARVGELTVIRDAAVKWEVARAYQRYYERSNDHDRVKDEEIAQHALRRAAVQCYGQETAGIVITPCSVCGSRVGDEPNNAAGTLRLVCYKCGHVYTIKETKVLLEGAKGELSSAQREVAEL